MYTRTAAIPNSSYRKETACHLSLLTGAVLGSIGAPVEAVQQVWQGDASSSQGLMVVTGAAVQCEGEAAGVLVLC